MNYYPSSGISQSCPPPPPGSRGQALILTLSCLGAVVAAAEAVAAMVAVHRITTPTSALVYSVLIPSTAVATVLVYLESPVPDSEVLY